MIQQHIDRSRSTGGGMATSFALHAALLFLLATAVGHQVAVISEQGELTEIAYIEARYGEDVASKVKLKEKPRRPQPPGRGVATDSAMKPKGDSPEAPRPEPRQATKPKPKLEAPPRLDPATRPQAARADVTAPDIAPKAQQQVLAEATQLEAKSPRPRARKVIDPSKLAGANLPRSAADAAAPVAAVRKDSKAFAPVTGGLTKKSGSVALGEDVLATGRESSSSGSGAIAEAPAEAVRGGGLKQSTRGTYTAPSSGIAAGDKSQSGSATGNGVLDVTGPSGSGGGTKNGRKTILDYGSGSGGRGSGGGLSSRARIADPVGTTEIVTKSTEAAEPKQQVSDAKLDGKGVNMTISGQIEGRKILSSVPPEYTAKARKNGWEGAVAVHFTVKADGKVKDNMYFEQTSVHRDLNQAAMAAIKQFLFAPLPSGQAAVEQWGVITIVFRLN